MAWDWKNKIGKFFGASAEPPAADVPANADQALPPAVAHAQAQLAGGTHRSYSRAELNDIAETLRDLKDATRNNMVVLNNLMKAQPRKDESIVKDLLAQVRTNLAAPYDSSEQAMVDLNSAANTLEKISAKAPAHDSAQDHLPVYDAQRDMVIGMTAQLRSIYMVHNNLAKVADELQPHAVMPEPDRVQQALASNHEKLQPMVLKLTGMAMGTLGRLPQPAPAL